MGSFANSELSPGGHEHDTWLSGTLPEMTKKAISPLSHASSDRKGFYLQVEGAVIDKRSQANDAAQTLE